ncbi:MAG: cyclase family protein [Pseudomonas sp.]
MAIKIHDISMTVHPDMLFWHEGKKPEMIRVFKIEDGEPSEVTRWVIGSHTGTHIDAPRHFKSDGKTVEQLDLARYFVGPVRVVDATTPDDRAIDAEMVQRANLDGATRVLFKTSNSEKRLSKDEYDFSYVGLTHSGAQALVDAGVQYVGIDWVCIEDARQCEQWPSHHVLLGNEVVILEGIDLSAIADGTYFMCSLPIKLKGSEAAWARTILIEGMDLSLFA